MERLSADEIIKLNRGEILLYAKKLIDNKDHFGCSILEDILVKYGKRNDLPYEIDEFEFMIDLARGSL